MRRVDFQAASAAMVPVASHLHPLPGVAKFHRSPPVRMGSRLQPIVRRSSRMRSAFRFFVVLSIALPALATDFKWSRLSGRNGWGDSSAWTPTGIPGPNDRALVTDSGSYTCFLDGNFE